MTPGYRHGSQVYPPGNRETEAELQERGRLQAELKAALQQQVAEAALQQVRIMVVPWGLQIVRA